MDDIAAAAGVTKPVLYQHFESKRALFVDVLRDVGGRLARRARHGHRRRHHRDATVSKRASLAYFRFVTENEAAFRVLFGAAARNDDEFAVVVDEVLDEVADAISMLIEIEGTVEHRRVLAHAVIGIAEATSRDALSGEDEQRRARRARPLGGRARRGSACAASAPTKRRRHPPSFAIASGLIPR